MTPNPLPRSGAQRAKQALILSGGGAYGAYEAGIIHALARGQSPATDYRAIAPHILTGTSVGAYSAAYLASRWQQSFQQATQELITTWLDVLSRQPGSSNNGVFRYRFDPSQYLNPREFLGHPVSTLGDALQDALHVGPMLERTLRVLSRTHDMSLGTRLASLFDVSGFISTQPLAHSIAETIDFNQVIRAPIQLRIAATQWKDDGILYASKGALDARQGPELIRASAAIPGVFSPVYFDHEPLVDGGVVLNIPFGPAIQAGASDLFVVSVPCQMSSIPLALRSTLGTLIRLQDASWANQLTVGLTLVSFHNQLLYGHSHQRSRQAAVEELFQYFDSDFSAQAPQHPLTVHLFRPTQGPREGPLGILDFDRPKIEQLIDLAIRDARHHDCAQQGCILARDPKTFSAKAVQSGSIILT